MRFGNIVAPFVHLCLATKFALLPTLRSIYATPTLLLSPKKLSRIFFANAWVAFSNGMDENSHEIKRNLLAPASGVVMDIGAGACRVSSLARLAYRYSRRAWPRHSIYGPREGESIRGCRTE
jgi:hypothetical protein